MTRKWGFCNIGFWTLKMKYGLHVHARSLQEYSTRAILFVKVWRSSQQFLVGIFKTLDLFYEGCLVVPGRRPRPLSTFLLKVCRGRVNVCHPKHNIPPAHPGRGPSPHWAMLWTWKMNQITPTYLTQCLLRNHAYLHRMGWFKFVGLGDGVECHSEEVGPQGHCQSGRQSELSILYCTSAFSTDFPYGTSDWGDFWTLRVEIRVFPSPTGYMLTSSGFPLLNWGIFYIFF